MNTRHIGIFGLAALGLVLGTPVQAAPDFMDDSFIVAKRDRDDEARQDRRSDRKDEQRQRASRGEAEREEPQGYGYGYERRQQQRNEEGDRPRGRR